MGPWASAVIAVASLVGVFIMVMGFRGLIEAMENFSGRCVTCARTTLLPLPAQSHECWRCHYTALLHALAGPASVHPPHLARAWRHRSVSVVVESLDDGRPAPDLGDMLLSKSA